MKLEPAALEEKLQKNMNRLKQIQYELMELEQGDSFALVIELDVHTDTYCVEALQFCSDDCSVEDMRRIDPAVRHSAIDTIHSFQQYVEQLSQKTGHSVARDLGITFAQSSEFILFLNKLQSPDMDPLPSLDTNDPGDRIREEVKRKIAEAGSINYVVVDNLPDPGAAEINLVYIVYRIPKRDDINTDDDMNTQILYDIYYVINGQWEKINGVMSGLAEEEPEPTQAEIDSQKEHFQNDVQDCIDELLEGLINLIQDIHLDDEDIRLHSFDVFTKIRAVCKRVNTIYSIMTNFSSKKIDPEQIEKLRSVVNACIEKCAGDATQDPKSSRDQVRLSLDWYLFGLPEFHFLLSPAVLDITDLQMFNTNPEEQQKLHNVIEQTIPVFARIAELLSQLFEHDETQTPSEILNQIHLQMQLLIPMLKELRISINSATILTLPYEVSHRLHRALSNIHVALMRVVFNLDTEFPWGQNRKEDDISHWSESFKDELRYSVSMILLRLWGSQFLSYFPLWADFQNDLFTEFLASELSEPSIPDFIAADFLVNVPTAINDFMQCFEQAEKLLQQKEPTWAESVGMLAHLFTAHHAMFSAISTLKTFVECFPDKFQDILNHSEYLTFLYFRKLVTGIRSLIHLIQSASLLKVPDGVSDSTKWLFDRYAWAFSTAQASFELTLLDEILPQIPDDNSTSST